MNSNNSNIEHPVVVQKARPAEEGGRFGFGEPLPPAPREENQSEKMTENELFDKIRRASAAARREILMQDRAALVARIAEIDAELEKEA